MALRNRYPSSRARPHLPRAAISQSGLVLAVADNQKSAWRRGKNQKEHDEKFITTGLWGISRHPKYVHPSFFFCPCPQNGLTRSIFHSYVGEVGLWTGLWLLSVTSLRSPYFPKGAWLMAGASPLLTWYLLARVSGVPPLEVRIMTRCERKFDRHLSYFSNRPPTVEGWKQEVRR